MRLLLGRLAPYSDRLPTPAKMALDTAQLYWLHGQGTEDDLEAASFDCWAYLNRLESEPVGDLPGARWTRAVLCALEPAGDQEDLSTLAEFFAQMLNGP